MTQNYTAYVDTQSATKSTSLLGIVVLLFEQVSFDTELTSSALPASGNVFQCVAVCCSVLQCVAVCCSVLHHAAVSGSAHGHTKHHAKQISFGMV